jgi:hypothetical protein
MWINVVTSIDQSREDNSETSLEKQSQTLVLDYTTAEPARSDYGTRQQISANCCRFLSFSLPRSFPALQLSRFEIHSFGHSVCPRNEYSLEGIRLPGSGHPTDQTLGGIARIILTLATATNLIAFKLGIVRPGFESGWPYPVHMLTHQVADCHCASAFLPLQIWA